IWSGVGSTGRSIDQVPAMKSAVVQGCPVWFSWSRTRCALSPIAATYHSAAMISSTVTRGRSRCHNAADAAGRAGRAPTSASLVIAVPLAERHAHLVRDLQELRRLARVERAALRQVAGDDFQDLTRSRAHHDDARG